jgi:hypothetical protein
MFDIDELAGDFEPVEIRFRGQEYVLGASVIQLLNAAVGFKDSAGRLKENASAEDQALAVFEVLRPTLRALSPELAKVIAERDLTPPEEAALLKPVTQAVQLLSRLSFRAEEPDTGDDSEVSELLPSVPAEGSDVGGQAEHT